jgi:hypothetical protein
MSSQESFFRQLANGDMPQKHYAEYQKFLGDVKGDHLICIQFSCGCWRFIENRALYQGRGYARVGTTVLTPTGKYTYRGEYLYPKTQIGCVNRIPQMEYIESWHRRKLQVFTMRVPYTHGYADHYFRTRAEGPISSTRRLATDIVQ